jgi:hypothetical protein
MRVMPIVKKDGVVAKEGRKEGINLSTNPRFQ